MSGKGDFFAIGNEQWAKACELGLNPAVVFMTMARGTGRDNSTTSWSAEAAFRYTGLAWRRGNDAIVKLCEAGLVTKEKGGKRPRYKLARPEGVESMIWLPNELVTGAASEIPPLAKLRQGQDINYLRAFVELYGEQDLTGDGGLPRRLIRTPYTERERICEWGQFDVIGFRGGGTSYCTTIGPFKRFSEKKEPKDGWASWKFLGAMENMGLLERVTYLAESDDPDSELIHPLTGDEMAVAVQVAAASLVAGLPGGFSYEAEGFNYVLPIPRHIPKAAVVGIMRLRYRPKTARTSAWYARHTESCRQYEDLYTRLAKGEFRLAVSQC
jgi:hypothetical protein